MMWAQTPQPTPPAAAAPAAPVAAPAAPKTTQETVVVVAKPERPVGDTTLRCKVTASGQVTTCEVASESPAGMGLAASAMRMAMRFRVDPLRQGGHPVAGVVLLPFKFQMASEAKAAVAAVPAKP